VYTIFVIVGEAGQDSLLVLAATAEQRSEHPIAQAILRAAQSRGISPLPLSEDASVSFVGSGVSCESGLGRILIGNRSFMKAQDVIFNAAADSTMWNLEIQGKTAICIALNHEVFGVLGLADVPKDQADSAVRTLRSMGMDVWMLTGDNATTAEALAHKLDISQDRVIAGMLPQDKVQKVKDLQAAGHIVAMIGDGVNDSPALAQADLGVAIGAGTQIAIEAASMVLVRSHLHDLVVAFDLAKVVFQRIRWNFLWALIYNVLAVPFAAGVWFPWTHILLPPHYAGLAMAMSSISVVISSSLLMRYHRPSLIDEASMMGDNNNNNVTTATSILHHTRNTINRIASSTASRHHNSSHSGGSGSNSSGKGGYNQLPRDEREWELSLGVELGLGSTQSHREEWNAIRDDVV
jgi:P-type Cu+ transporter